MGKLTNYIVFDNGDERLCIEDTHRGDEAMVKEAGGDVLGNVLAATPKEAIEYIDWLKG